MEIKIVIQIFLVVCLNIVLCYEEEPREGQPGVCSKIVSQVQTIRKTFICGKHKRCSRMEQMMVPTKKILCCDGWKYYEGKCVPENPVCEEPCVNGLCTGSNNCTCNPGLVHLNETHCGPLCTNGYYNDFSVATLPCKSKCSQECVNGTCTDFDTCTCNSGYRLKVNSQFECEPVCETCENGVCVEPDKCSCNLGYAKNESGVCVPVCTEECNNGYCSAPEKCECNPGYSKSEGHQTCVPICTVPCINGFCAAPFKCECNSGYSYDEGLKTCAPICTEECDNGYCAAPEKCECNPGYTYNDVLKICIPVCKVKCVNSSCISPDKCECWSGYLYSNATASCEPYCSSCRNGDCIAPDLCICREGYEKHNNTCEIIPLRSCRGCEATCNETACACANGTPCVSSTEEAIVASTPTLAGLQLTWMLGGAIGILLLVFLLVIIHRTWRQRKNYEQKVKGTDYHERDSVMFTRPETLIRKKYQDTENNEEDDYDEVEQRQTNLDLLPRVPSEDHIERI